MKKRTVQLKTLTPGQRFRYPESGKSATLLSHGPMASKILFDNASRQVTITREDGDEVSFTSPGRPELVSDYSDVEVL